MLSILLSLGLLGQTNNPYSVESAPSMRGEAPVYTVETGVLPTPDPSPGPIVPIVPTPQPAPYPTPVPIPAPYVIPATQTTPQVIIEVVRPQSNAPMLGAPQPYYGQPVYYGKPYGSACVGGSCPSPSVMYRPGLFGMFRRR